MKNIFVVSFAPDYTFTLGVGGFDWFPKREDAVKYASQRLEEDLGAEVCFRAIPVPAELSGDEITEYLENHPEWMDLAQPAEWSLV